MPYVILSSTQSLPMLAQADKRMPAGLPLSCLKGSQTVSVVLPHLPENQLGTGLLSTGS